MAFYRKWWFWLSVTVIIPFLIIGGYINYIQYQKQQAIDFVKNYRGVDGRGPKVVEAAAAILTLAVQNPYLVDVEWDAATRDGGWQVNVYISYRKIPYTTLKFWTDFNTVKALNEEAEYVLKLVNMR